MDEIILFSPRVNKTIGSKGAMLPLSLLAISSLIHTDFKIKILDGNVNDNLDQLVDNEIRNPLCVGISSMTGHQITSGLQFAKRIRDKNKNIPIIWGGMHPSILPEQTALSPFVDYVVRGQGELIFKELATSIGNERDYSNILGISYKENDKVIHSKDRELNDINSFPPLPYHLVNVENYIKNIWYVNTRTIAYISSIGCPFDCAFCTDKAIYKKRWSGLNVERIINDISYLKNTFSVNGIIFYDNLFFTDKNRVIDFCSKVINENLNIKWFACGRATALAKYSDEEWRLLKDSGCTRISVGAESGSQEVLDLLNKKAKVEDTIEFLMKCKKHHIQAEPSLMIGLPDAPEKDFWETMELIDNIFKADPDNVMILYFYAPYPGSALYEKAKSLGFLEPQVLEDWSHYMLREAHTPWISKKYINRGKFVINFVLPYAFFSDIRELHKNKKFSYFVKHAIAKMRWKFKFFSFPIELKLIKYYNMFKRNIICEFLF